MTSSIELFGLHGVEDSQAVAFLHLSLKPVLHELFSIKVNNHLYVYIYFALSFASSFKILAFAIPGPVALAGFNEAGNSSTLFGVKKRS